MSEKEVARILRQVIDCIQPPTGIALAWLMLPHLIDVMERQTNDKVIQNVCAHLPPVHLFKKLQSEVNALITASTEDYVRYTPHLLNNRVLTTMINQLVSCLQSAAGPYLISFLLPPLIDNVKIGNRPSAPP